MKHCCDCGELISDYAVFCYWCGYTYDSEFYGKKAERDDVPQGMRYIPRKSLNPFENIEDISAVAEKSNLFTNKELALCWKNRSDAICSYILIHCLTGLTTKELLDLKNENVDVFDMYFIGGAHNRKMPIHGKIQAIVNNVYWNSTARKSEYLIFGDDGARMTMDNYQKEFKIAMAKYKMKHTTKDCRQTFIERAKAYQVDKKAFDYLVGHCFDDLTKEMYPEEDPLWLYKEIEKME